MFAKKNNLEKEPTSKLIYQLTYETSQQLQVEDVLLARLQRKYHLDKEQSRNFIEIEQGTLRIRDKHLYSYLFGSSNTGEQCLRRFYEKEKDIAPNLIRRNHLNSFTFSELAILAYLFQLLEMMFYNRMVTLKKSGYDEKDAKHLREYYGFLRNLVTLKMNDLIELASDKKIVTAYKKESRFIRQYTNEFQDLVLEAMNLSANPFEKHKTIAEESGAKVFLFQ